MSEQGGFVVFFDDGKKKSSLHKMKTNNTKLTERVLKAIAPILEIVAAVRRSKKYNDGQNSGAMFRVPEDQKKTDAKTGRPWARQDWRGSLQVTCPYCDCESLHWMNAGVVKLPDGTNMVDVAIRKKSVDNLQAAYNNRFQKSDRQAKAAEMNYADEMEAKQVAVTSDEMRKPDNKEPKTTRDMTETSKGTVYGVYDVRKTVGVEDKTLVDGQPLAEGETAEERQERSGIAAMQEAYGI